MEPTEPVSHALPIKGLNEVAGRLQTRPILDNPAFGHAGQPHPTTGCSSLINAGARRGNHDVAS
jgi:hypothetical protein